MYQTGDYFSVKSRDVRMIRISIKVNAIVYQNNLKPIYEIGFLFASKLQAAITKIVLLKLLTDIPTFRCHCHYCFMFNS